MYSAQGHLGFLNDLAEELIIFKNNRSGTGEVAPCERELAVLAEDPVQLPAPT